MGGNCIRRPSWYWLADDPVDPDQRKANQGAWNRLLPALIHTDIWVARQLDQDRPTNPGDSCCHLCLVFDSKELACSNAAYLYCGECHTPCDQRIRSYAPRGFQPARFVSSDICKHRKELV